MNTARRMSQQQPQHNFPCLSPREAGRGAEIISFTDLVDGNTFSSSNVTAFADFVTIVVVFSVFVDDGFCVAISQKLALLLILTLVLCLRGIETRQLENECEPQYGKYRVSDPA